MSVNIDFQKKKTSDFRQEFDYFLCHQVNIEVNI